MTYLGIEPMKLCITTAKIPQKVSFQKKMPSKNPINIIFAILSFDKLNLKKSSHPNTSYMESQEGELYNLLISCHNNIVITDNYDLIPSSRKSCRSLTSKWQKVLVTQ